MAYILHGDRILKVITKSNDIELTNIVIDDKYPYETHLMFDFKTNILIENEIFEITGYFGKTFDKYYNEEKEHFFITLHDDDLSDKLTDNLFTIKEYIENNLTNVALEEDTSERFLLKHKYLNKPLECYLNIHLRYIADYNSPILSYDYNTRYHVARLTKGLIEYLKDFYKTDFSEFEKIEIK